MAEWQSITNRINEGSNNPNGIPLVIAGPMLRKTTKNEVSVWIALKKSATVTLKIYKKSTHDSGSIQVLMSASSPTIQIGSSLHIALITAQGTTLQEETIYYYDLVFDDIPTGFVNPVNMLDTGVLKHNETGEGVLNYPDHSLPSFLIPTSDLNKLKVMHGSCRKSHGGENGEAPDALAGLDQILYITSNDTDDRPHQLMLTGDQIYSDDVPEVLLYMIEDAADNLIGLPEDFQADFNIDLDRETLKVKEDFRRDAIGEAELTSKFGSYGFYHLMKLGEFYAMYLFAWSDVLWGKNDLPKFNIVRPGVSDSVTAPGGTAPGSSSITLSSTKYSKFKKTIPPVEKFRETLPSVRRALANIPVYMMFDDHEVTDDWFLSRKWCETTLGGFGDSGNPIAQRIIQNGLSAFGVFQAWGNTPTYFSPGSQGRTLLNRLKSLSVNPSSFGSTIADIKNDILPQIVADSPLDKYDQGTHLSGGLTWNYHIEFENHQLIALDPRTKRGFRRASTNRQKRRGTALLSEQAMVDQFAGTSTSSSVTFLLSPAPIVGHPKVEWAQRTFQNPFDGQSITSENDQEAWSFNTWCFNNIFLTLAPFQHVIILSGDVHYGFSSTVNLWDNRLLGTANEKRATIVQLTASSLKNQTASGITGGTIKLGKDGVNIKSKYYYLGWKNNNTPVEYTTSEYMMNSSHTVHHEINGRPAQFERILPINSTPSFPTFNSGPDWQFSFFFHNDARPDSARGTYDDVDIQYPSNVDKYRYARNQRLRGDLSANTAVVGKNNIGMVKLTWTAVDKRVHHSFWFNTGKKLLNQSLPGLLVTDLFNPYTIHDIEDFNLPSGTKPY